MGHLTGSWPLASSLFLLLSSSGDERSEGRGDGFVKGLLA